MEIVAALDISCMPNKLKPKWTKNSPCNTVELFTEVYCSHLKIDANEKWSWLYQKSEVAAICDFGQHKSDDNNRKLTLRAHFCIDLVIGQAIFDFIRRLILFSAIQFISGNCFFNKFIKSLLKKNVCLLTVERKLNLICTIAWQWLAWLRNITVNISYHLVYECLKLFEQNKMFRWKLKIVYYSSSPWPYLSPQNVFAGYSKLFADCTLFLI